MKNLVLTIVLAVVVSFFSGCASTSQNTHAGFDQSMTDQALTFGITGIPAASVNSKIKAIEVEAPALLDQESVRKFVEDKHLDGLIIVNVAEETEVKTNAGAVAGKVGLFALSIVVSAISRTSANLNGIIQATGSTVKIVTTTVNMYGRDGLKNFSEKYVKETTIDASTTETALDSLKGFLVHG
jgi:uncharacterized membrane protein